jgi:hypothetical protein
MHDSDNSDIAAACAFASRMRNTLGGSELKAQWMSEYGIQTGIEMDDICEEHKLELANLKAPEPKRTNRR